MSLESIFGDMKTTGEKKELGSAEDGFDSRGSQALKADDWDFTSATLQCGGFGL